MRVSVVLPCFNEKGNIQHTVEDVCRWFAKTGEELPMYVAKEFNHSLHENSALRPILESIRGKAFTDEELITGVSLAKVAGVPCQIEIGHTKTGKAKVVKVFGIAKGMTCPPAKHEVFAYEIENGLNDKFNKLPEWVQKKIVLAKEWTFGKKIDDATYASDNARMESLANPGDDVAVADLPF